MGPEPALETNTLFPGAQRREFFHQSFPAGDGLGPRSVNMRDRPLLNQTKSVFF